MSKSILEKKDARLAWQMLIPSLAVIGLLILYPLVFNIYLSFFNVRLGQENEFVGLANYIRLLSDTAYAHSWFITIIYLVGTVFGVTLLGLLVALLLNQEFRGRNVVRLIMLIPYIAPVASVMFGWRFFFGDRGAVSWALQGIGITEAPINIIGDPSLSLLIVILFDIWKHFPLTALLLLSQLQSIPRDRYEVAAMDGYGSWGSFIHVTLPECRFVLGTIIILRVIWNFNRFEDVFLIAGSQVPTLPIYTYMVSMTGSLELGFAAAISVVSLIVLMVFIIIYVKKVLRW